MIVYGLFHGSATWLRSDRGQSGIIVAAIVLAGILIVEFLWFRRSVPALLRTVGLGAPRTQGLTAAAWISGALLLVVPAFAWTTGTTVTTAEGWEWLVPGLFAQAGIAEEALFRGYLFGHVRRSRTFWRAAAISMLPFVAVHLVLFATLPLPVAVAALLLAVGTSFPMAQLFEIGGRTIWAPALLHAVVQGAVKVIVVGDDHGVAFAMVWMAASAIVPFLAFLLPRPSAAGC